MEGGRLSFRNCVAGFVDASSVGERLWPWVSATRFHAGCGALTSLALKVKGIESLQDVPGRDFWLCQQRAWEQASFSFFWPQFLPWQSRARDAMSGTELCCLALEMCLVRLAGPALAMVKPFPPRPLPVCCQIAALTWENTSGKLPLLKGGDPSEAGLAWPQELQSPLLRRWGLVLTQAG